jgi:RNA polymerase sigma-70 factor, ECF subfamily
MSPQVLVAAAGRSIDAESEAWVRQLSSVGHEREDAVKRLHARLLHAARFELGRRRTTAALTAPGDVDDLAVQAADDALIAILRKLHNYRGDSRFTTWAYKFAVLEASVKARRRAWHGRELPLEADGLAELETDNRACPAERAEAYELIGAVRDALTEVLTPHQRAVLVAITLNNVPIDVLAERRNTTRGALYKTLHDSRRKLRTRLENHDLT